MNKFKLFVFLVFPSPIICVSFVTVTEIFCGEVLEAFVILSAISLQIKSPVASAVFCISLFELLYCLA